MHKSTISLPDEIVHEIRSISSSEGRSEAEIVRAALDAYVERRRSDVPAIFGTFSGGTIGAAKSEDWLRDHWNRE